MAFVDVRMPPGWDGVETTQRIWEIDPDVQIVICTAYSDYSWGEMFEKIGSRDGLLILKKPFDAVEAFQLAQALTEKWWLHQQFRRKMEELESRVAERTGELQQTNHALQTEVAEHQLAEESLRDAEAKYRGLFENAIEGIYQSTPDGHYLAVNAALARIYGYESPEEIMNQVSDIQNQIYVDPIFRERFKHEIETAGVVRGFEYQVRHRDGSILWITESARAIRSPDGPVRYYEGFIEDITARKRTEQAVLLLSSAVEQSKEAIVITDAELNLPGPKIIFVNPAFTKMTGYTAEEAIGKTPRILQGPRTDKTVLRRLRQNLEKGESFQGEAVNYRKDGTEFNLQWQIGPIRNASGVTTHFVAIQHDITERKRATEELRESEEKFRQLAENIRDVFWMTSPDLQQVLYVSPAYERLWGRSAANASDHPHEWSDAIVPGDRDRVFASFGRLTGDRIERERRVSNRASQRRAAMDPQPRFSSPGCRRQSDSADGHRQRHHRAQTVRSPAVSISENGNGRQTGRAASRTSSTAS